MNAFSREMPGSNYFDYRRDCKCVPEAPVLYEPKGDQVEVTTEDSATRYLLVSGRPIGKPLACYGSIVMNTLEDLQLAFEEYEKDTFIKHN